MTSTASATTTPRSSTTSAAGSTPAAGAGRLNAKNGGFSTAVPQGWRDDAGGSPASAFNYLNKTGLGQHLHVQQIVVPHGGYTYTITYTALASGYARSLSALEQVVHGWRWQ